MLLTEAKKNCVVGAGGRLAGDFQVMMGLILVSQMLILRPFLQVIRK
jgi:hypothetical protein